MTGWTITLRLCGCLVIACAIAFLSPVSWAASKGYGRAYFNFEQPTRLKASVEGSTATLRFDKPVKQSAGAIKASLPGYIAGVQVSADKRTVTLTMNQSYRLRQFVSGTNVGIDLMGEPTETASAKPEDISGPVVAEAKPDPVPVAKQAPPAPKPEKKPAPAKPAAKKPEKPKPVVKKAPAPSAPKPAEPVKKPEPVVASKPEAEKPPAAPEPVAAPAPAAEDPILSTKSPVPEESAPAPTPASESKPESTVEPKPDTSIMTTKSEAAPEPAPAAEPILTTKTEPPAPAAEPTPEPVATPAPSPAEPAAAPAPEPAPATPAATASAPKPQEPFLVTARTANGETIIHFPWTSRVAAATFKRSKDIWVVFSEAKDVNAGLLRTIVPKQVVNVVQYHYSGNTVIRLVTDGSLSSSASQDKGGYGWDIKLNTAPNLPALDVSVAADSLEGTTRLILGAFDIAPALRFFDPGAGDELIIIPSYENGRGVSNARSFPEFALLPTTQGIAVINQHPDLTLSQTRSGLILSSKNGLAVSENLPILSGAAPVAGASASSGVMIPFDQWYVPREKFRETQMERIHAVGTASKAAKPDALFDLAKLYLAEGMGSEAAGYLRLIKEEFPEYYANRKLALLSAASHFMDDRITKAAEDLLAPELIDLEETTLWREVIALYAPPPNTAQNLERAIQNQNLNVPNDSTANTPPPADGHAAAPNLESPVKPAPYVRPNFHFLKHNKPYIRFYPPRIRQRLATVAAEAYIEDGQEEKALATFDTLMRDNIIEPVALEAELALGTVAKKKGEKTQAYEIFDRLKQQTENPRVAVQARYLAALMRYEKGDLKAEDAIEELEGTRIGWHGDPIERKILQHLINIYMDTKQYDEVLRSYRTILDAFPNDPDALAISGQISDLFERVFLDGLADDMPPLKALSLFYEFRGLTPLGDKGDAMIQKLADRLAAMDLIDRATQLLDNQVRFRSKGEARSRIGARLALLHLVNHHPQEALKVLEVTNYGGNRPELQLQRQQLNAEALLKIEKYEEALGVISNDSTKAAAILRLEILWAMRDWPNVINRAEDILNARPNLTEPLSPQETEVLLKLALGYSFETDFTQLRYLRDYYAGLIPDNNYKQIFDFITNDTAPLDPEDFDLLAKQISNAESFLSTFKSKIAAGRLSETIR